MKANTKMIRNMATVSTLGPIQDNIKDGGSEVSSTDLENTAFLAKTLSSASGKTGNVSSGLLTKWSEQSDSMRKTIELNIFFLKKIYFTIELKQKIFLDFAIFISDKGPSN